MTRVALAVATLMVVLSAPAGARVVAGQEYLVDRDVSVEVPESVNAGDPLRVHVAAARPDRTTVRVVFRSSYRAAGVETVLVGGEAMVAAPHGMSEAAGVLHVAAQVGGTWASTAVDVLPGPIAAPPVPMIGARSVFAGDTDRSLVVVIPSDAFGNPVVDGPVTVTARWPGGAVDTFTPSPAATLLWVWLPAHRVAGRTLVTATAGAVPGLERTLRVVPGEVQTVTFDVEGGPHRADGVSLIAITTAQLTDAYGNIVLDGTEVVVHTLTASGHRASHTVATVNGIARALVEAPPDPGAFHITVTAGAATAQGTVELAAALGTVSPQVRIASRPGPDLIEVGPIVGDLGQIVPDGTAVEVWADGGAATATGLTRAGIASMSMELAGIEMITVEVGGRRVLAPVGEAP